MQWQAHFTSATHFSCKALRQCQSGYMQLSRKTRELCLEKMALEEQLKKTRKRAGGRVPPQLVPYIDPVVTAAKRYAPASAMWMCRFLEIARENLNPRC